jgi:hypothetical protein
VITRDPHGVSGRLGGVDHWWAGFDDLDRWIGGSVDRWIGESRCRSQVTGVDETFTWSTLGAVGTSLVMPRSGR